MSSLTSPQAVVAWAMPISMPLSGRGTLPYYLALLFNLVNLSSAVVVNADLKPPPDDASLLKSALDAVTMMSVG